VRCCSACSLGQVCRQLAAAPMDRHVDCLTSCTDRCVSTWSYTSLALPLPACLPASGPATCNCVWRQLHLNVTSQAVSVCNRIVDNDSHVYNHALLLTTTHNEILTVLVIASVTEHPLQVHPTNRKNKQTRPTWGHSRVAVQGAPIKKQSLRKKCCISAAVVRIWAKI